MAGRQRGDEPEAQGGGGAGSSRGQACATSRHEAPQARHHRRYRPRLAARRAHPFIWTLVPSGRAGPVLTIPPMHHRLAPYMTSSVQIIRQTHVVHRSLPLETLALIPLCGQNVCALLRIPNVNRFMSLIMTYTMDTPQMCSNHAPMQSPPCNYNKAASQVGPSI